MELDRADVELLAHALDRVHLRIRSYITDADTPEVSADEYGQACEQYGQLLNTYNALLTNVEALGKVSAWMDEGKEEAAG